MPGQADRIIRDIRHQADLPGSAVVSQAYRIGMMQVRSEIETLAALLTVEAFRGLPAGFIEIGSAFGGSFRVFSSILQGVKVSVDLPSGRGACGNDAAAMETRNAQMRSWAPDVLTVLGDSNDSHTQYQVARHLGGGVGFLFIDGDHRYESIQRDWNLWAPLVAAGGIIAMHDVKPECKGVHRLWQELGDTGVRRLEILDPAVSWGGIGVVWHE